MELHRNHLFWEVCSPVREINCHLWDRRWKHPTPHRQAAFLPACLLRVPTATVLKPYQVPLVLWPPFFSFSIHYTPFFSPGSLILKYLNYYFYYKLLHLFKFKKSKQFTHFSHFPLLPLQPPICSLSMGLFFIRVFVFLDSRYRRGPMFIFLWLMLLIIMPLRSIHVAENPSFILFYEWITVHCMYQFIYSLIHWWTIVSISWLL